ncbi:MAG: methylmalonyl-CoA mutase family protein [Pseudomonadota bacterium]
MSGDTIAVDRARWEAEVARVARGTPIDALLNRRFPGAVSVPCLHTPTARPNDMPGAGDRRRGFSATTAPWLIGQFWPSDPRVAADAVAAEATQGVQAWQLPADGFDADCIAACVRAVGSSAAIDLGGSAAQAHAAIDAAPDTCINANIDCFARALDTGVLADAADVEALLGELVGRYRTPLGHRLVSCDGARYHASGASDTTELAVMFATFVAWLRHFDALGHSVPDAAALTVLRPAVTVSVVPTLAKLRALRAGLSAICHHCGAADAVERLRIHALPASRELSRTGPWVNSLRSSAMVLGAALGGADTVFSATHDGTDTAAARRLSRNTQLVLQHESRLADVQDPAGGSGQIEAHTDALLAQAWQQFQDIETAGGMAAVLRTGELAATLQREAGALLNDVRHRRRAITGVSLHPDPEGPAQAPEDADSDGLRCPTLRASDPFDRLRARAQDAPVHATVVTLSDAPLAQARATFCLNLLGAGGIDTTTSAQPSAVLVCGTDDDYAQLDSAALARLTPATETPVYVAGGSTDARAHLATLAVTGHISAGDDVIAFLDALHTGDARA